MIRHIVMFRMNDKAETEAAVAKLASVDGKIPSVRSLEVGIDKLGGERSYDVAIHTTFDDLAGLKDYAEHPEHQPVIEWMRAHTSAAASVDYEF